MENIQPRYESLKLQQSTDSKNLIILLLLIIVVFSFLGVNLLYVSGNILETIYGIFSPLIGKILSLFGYSTGVILNTTTDVVTDVSKTGIDLVGGAVTDVGDLLIKSSGMGQGQGQRQRQNELHQKHLDLTLNKSKKQKRDHTEDTSENPIQKPISASKSGWCLIGEYEEKRKCFNVNEKDTCVSGKIFPNEKACSKGKGKGNGKRNKK